MVIMFKLVNSMILSRGIPIVQMRVQTQKLVSRHRHDCEDVSQTQ